MALELTISCDSDKIETGPTLIHSIGIPDYKIPLNMIQILQESLTNDLLSDTEDGVLCQENPQRILEILSQLGFVLQSQNNDDQKASWLLMQKDDEQKDSSDANENNEVNAAEGDQEDQEKGENNDEGENEQNADE